MFIDSWNEFAQRAKKMYLADPMKTRYVIRYNHEQSSLVVKVTDNVKCLQFKTDQHADAKKLDELHSFFLSLMAGMDPDDLAAEGDASASLAQPQPKPQDRRSKR